MNSDSHQLRPISDAESTMVSWNNIGWFPLNAFTFHYARALLCNGTYKKCKKLHRTLLTLYVATVVPTKSESDVIFCLKF